MKARMNKVHAAWALSRFGPALALVAMLFSASLAQGQSADRTKQVGRKLMCMCGCGQVLTECNHLDCPLSVPMLKQVSNRVAAGDSDDLIVQSFVQQFGEKVLSEPPTHGFNSVAWMIPGIAFAMGLGLVVLVIWQWRHAPRPAMAAASPGAPISAQALECGRQQADRETED